MTAPDFTKPNPEFDKWKGTLPTTHWAKYDLSACRLGWEAATGQIEKLQAFKTWVHNYLDEHGVPHHPPGTHGAEGCRIGDRMDWLMAQLSAAKEVTTDNLCVVARVMLSEIADSGYLRAKLTSDETGMQERLEALVKSFENPSIKLTWSDPSEPNADCHYHHTIAQTPLGRFLLTWKGWKDDPNYGFDETPWSEAAYGGWNSIAGAQEWAAQELQRRCMECFKLQ